MHTVLTVVQFAVSILLMIAILSQQRGAGLGSVFGGSGGFYTSKRGIEKFLHNATIILAAIFLLNSIAFLFVK